MFFKVHSTVNNLASSRARVKKYAKLIVVAYRHKLYDTKLDRYLLENYQMNLTQACLLIIHSATFQQNKDHDIIVTFLNPAIDDLASLITYGNREIQGSTILVDAFGGRDK